MRSCRNKKVRYIIGISITLLVIIITFGLIKGTVSHDITSETPQNSLCFEKICFELEIAGTSESREKGLMYRTELDEDKGMLFIFDTVGIYPFWMKNTLIPLDIVRLNETYEVVYIQHDTTPCEADPCASYNPVAPSKYVLELNGGVTEKIGLAVGAKTEFYK